MQPKTSIITVCDNSAKTIEDTIQLEIIVITFLSSK